MKMFKSSAEKLLEDIRAIKDKEKELEEMKLQIKGLEAMELGLETMKLKVKETLRSLTKQKETKQENRTYVEECVLTGRNRISLEILEAKEKLLELLIFYKRDFDCQPSINEFIQKLEIVFKESGLKHLMKLNIQDYNCRFDKMTDFRNYNVTRDKKNDE